MNVAINGFGRIGRQAFKIALKKPEIQIVAINDLSNARVLAHLLKYDSVYGISPETIQIEEDGVIVDTEGRVTEEEHFVGNSPDETFLIVNNHRVKVFAEPEPTKLPWKSLEVDVVLECTGRFTRDGAAKVHVSAGAKKVVVSAPTKGTGDIQTYLKGVNHDKYNNEEVISNASCTTNCVSPVASVMQASFGIQKAMMTTIHSVTAEQNLVDGNPPALHEDLRRGRSALVNIVPTTTGAARATSQTIPELEGIFDGMAVRVPTIIGSLSDFTFLVEKDTDVKEVNDAFIKARENPFYRGVIDVSFEPIVSSDIVGSTYSAIVDLTMTQVVGGNMVKVLAWYDNEWGYSNRLIEMAQQVGQTL